MRGDIGRHSLTAFHSSDPMTTQELETVDDWKINRRELYHGSSGCLSSVAFFRVPRK